MSNESEQPQTPPKTAVALRYDPEKGDAPVVVATGEGFVADQILNIAKKHKVPIREDRALANALSSLNLGSYIPPEMYRAVAEVLAFVYRLENGGKR